MPMAEAAKIGDVFVTVTGNYHVIREEHFEAMKDGAIVCNSGHFNDELDLDALEKLADAARPRRARSSSSTRCRTARTVCVLGEGRLINLAAGEGHPAAVMDMSFANQAMAAAYLAQNYKTPREEGLLGARRDRRGSRAAQARLDGHRDRHARRPNR